MKVDVLVLISARMQFSARIKKVNRSSFSKRLFKNPHQKLCQWEIRTKILTFRTIYVTEFAPKHPSSMGNPNSVQVFRTPLHQARPQHQAK
jgi:hypothetical protein